MSNTCDYEDICAWLRNTAKTQLEWTTDDADLRAWVDVRIPSLEADVGLNWVWTVVSEFTQDDYEAENPTEILAPHDRGTHWSHEFITQVLMKWIVVHVGRSDITLKYNPDLPRSRAMRIAQETIDRIHEGTEPTFDLGDNIYASDQVMDFLLEDLERATEIMKAVKQDVTKRGLGDDHKQTINPEKASDRPEGEQ